jgi:hypothetical protein
MIKSNQLRLANKHIDRDNFFTAESGICALVLREEGNGAE